MSGKESAISNENWSKSVRSTARQNKNKKNHSVSSSAAAIQYTNPYQLMNHITHVRNRNIHTLRAVSELGNAIKGPNGKIAHLRNAKKRSNLTKKMREASKRHQHATNAHRTLGETYPSAIHPNPEITNHLLHHHLHRNMGQLRQARWNVKTKLNKAKRNYSVAMTGLTPIHEE